MSVVYQFWRHTLRIITLIILLIIAFPGVAQEITHLPITIENVGNLQSVIQLNFNGDNIFMPPLSPQGEAQYYNNRFDVGWFVYSTESDRFLLVDKENTLGAVFTDGAMTDSLPEADVIDAVPFGDGFYAILQKTLNGFRVNYSNFSLYGGTSLQYDVISDSLPVAIWITCLDNTNSSVNACYASVEASDGELTYILQIPSFDIIPGGAEEYILNESDLEQNPYSPTNDEEAVVRIGRIPLPYVVTSSLDGIVKLWNLDTDEILYEVDNGTGEPSVFGNINADATHLVWRDNANQTLYLLDFETAENREIASLNGDYAQWYFLSNDASVIIAVNIGGEPNVVVWDTETGERTDLGNYRDCERPQPDMARLTEDGTTLIIGCDTGLDIWRINQEG